MAQGRADKRPAGTENWRIVPAVFQACAAIDTAGGAAQVSDGLGLFQRKDSLYICQAGEVIFQFDAAAAVDAGHDNRGAKETYPDRTGRWDDSVAAR